MSSLSINKSIANEENLITYLESAPMDYTRSQFSKHLHFLQMSSVIVGHVPLVAQIHIKIWKIIEVDDTKSGTLQKLQICWFILMQLRYHNCAVKSRPTRVSKTGLIYVIFTCNLDIRNHYENQNIDPQNNIKEYPYVMMMRQIS